MNTTIINLRTLAAVSLASSTEAVRYYLNGVLIQCRADHTLYVATDGHRMIVVREDITKDDEANSCIGDFIVPLANCRAFKPGKGKHRAGGLDFAQLSRIGKELRLESSHGIQVFQPVDGTFPDYQRAIPSEMSGEHDGISFNPSYLSDFVKFAEIMNCGAGALALNGGGPAAVVFPDHNILGILMPMRSSPQAQLQSQFIERREFVTAVPSTPEIAKAA